MSIDELVSLAKAMVDAFIKDGGVKAVMPEGRRNEVASTLPLLMFDKNALEVYSHALTDEQERRGVWFDVPSRALPAISESLFKQIALNGFDFLSPEQLACIAVSALGLLVVRDSICHELQLRLPDWLYKALVLEKFYN